MPDPGVAVGVSQVYGAVNVPGKLPVELADHFLLLDDLLFEVSSVVQIQNVRVGNRPRNPPAV